MKKILSILCLLGFFAMNSLQAGIFDNENPSDEEMAAYEEYQTMETDPGAPGDANPSPIDQYIPVLILVATAVAGYAVRKKISLSEQ
ncbi:hypothetical protein [Amniculibacterium sp. G2-70]|uniref:hypothetical protein n=1 Tax=Amniculibacterium sp. G2-70 TaxID=2767188 RepID=UPI0016548821|nr:hypothetical protein [Amniculibacterium sp. G2-70]